MTAMGRIIVILTLIAVTVAAVTASAASSGGERRAARDAAAARPTVKAGGSSYGRIVFDGRGFALYAFTRDRKGGRSTCYGDCARAWPPYILKGSLKAPPGISRSLLGTVRRADGRRQVTFAGRPLYYYVNDRNPGDVFCQNVREFGGLWLVVRPGGSLVR